MWKIMKISESSPGKRRKSSSLKPFFLEKIYLIFSKAMRPSLGRYEDVTIHKFVWEKGVCISFLSQI